MFPPLEIFFIFSFEPRKGFEPPTYGLPACLCLSPLPESNWQPTVYKTVALPIELKGHIGESGQAKPLLYH